MNLKEKVRSLPNTPGVYLMKDKDENIIYIGKSKNLKNRVSQYFTPSYAPSKKIIRMIKFINDIEIIHTDSELDALLLECELIKKIQPMYNTLMKNDNKYTYIKIDMNEDYPTLEVVHEITDDSLYFGPYTSSYKLENIKEILLKYFKLRQCGVSNKLKGCLNYDLGICMGPCRNKDKVSYNKGLNALIETLKGNDEEIIISLEKEMKFCVNNLKFEEAQKYKEDIESIKSISSKSKSINFIKENYNVLALTKASDNTKKLYYLKGKEVKFTKILANKDIKNKEYIQTIIEDIKLYLSFEGEKFVNTTIGKEELDICTIIYNYLKHSKDCKYLILNEEITDVELCKWIVDFD